LPSHSPQPGDFGRYAIEPNMKSLDVKPFIGSKDCPWFIVFQLDVDRHVAASWFSCAPHVEWVDGLGDADYWAVEFNCGLRVTFEFLHFGNGASVFASEPVPHHVQRHLSHWREFLNEYPPETFELDRTYMIQAFAVEMPQLMKLHSYQLWRQGDDGNQVKVGFPTSLQDATCWQAELESHKHKQIYWVSEMPYEQTK
jgi:hypothetical protein